LTASAGTLGPQAPGIGHAPFISIDELATPDPVEPALFEALAALEEVDSLDELKLAVLGFAFCLELVSASGGVDRTAGKTA